MSMQWPGDVFDAGTTKLDCRQLPSFACVFEIPSEGCVHAKMSNATRWASSLEMKRDDDNV